MTQTTTMNAIDVVKTFHDAFNNHDWEGTRALMTDDYTFRGPLMQADSPEELIEQVKAFGCVASKSETTYMSEGDTVLVFFTWNVTAPFQGNFRMAEKLELRDGKIRSSELIYDPRGFPEM